MTMINRDALIWIEMQAKDLEDGAAFRPNQNAYWGTIHRVFSVTGPKGVIRELIPDQNFLFVLSEEMEREQRNYKIFQVHKDHKCFISFRADEIERNLKPALEPIL